MRGRLPTRQPPSREKVRARLRELYVSAALVHRQAAALDCELEAGAVFRRRSLVLEQHWPIDQLNVDTAILHRLDRIGDLDKFSGGGFRVGIGSAGGEFHRATSTFVM
jgi:hypothetical protein